EDTRRNASLLDEWNRSNIFKDADPRREDENNDVMHPVSCQTQYRVKNKKQCSAGENLPQ
ncbi:hypothetical protein LEMLEM_LOCUS8021, partial [Lemmus lemmus]